MSRLEFTNKTKNAAYKRSNGICECHRVPMLNRPQGCGQKLTEGRIRYEHIVPDEIRPDNSLENCAVLALGCWREKTDKYDLPTIAKSNRQRNAHIGIKSSRSRFPCGKDSEFKKKITGEVVRRG
jgi:hypothetical protein